MFKVYEKLLTLDKKYLTGREVARALNINPKNRRVVLSRLAKQKVLRRLRRNLYEVSFKPSDILEAANSLYQPSYLSFTYCLGKLGILNQIAYEIEFATPRKTKRLEMRGRNIIFRKIKKELFFGYLLKENIYIAKPEKALLDALYLRSKGLAGLSEEELNLKGISRTALYEMSRKFPDNVRRQVKALFEKAARPR